MDKTNQLTERQIRKGAVMRHKSSRNLYRIEAQGMGKFEGQWKPAVHYYPVDKDVLCARELSYFLDRFELVSEAPEQPADLPWHIAEADKKKNTEIVDALGNTIAKLTALDIPSAERIVAAVNAQAVRPAVDPATAHWLSLAHMACADAGVPPGHIEKRLEQLQDLIQLNKLQMPLQAGDCPQFLEEDPVIPDNEPKLCRVCDESVGMVCDACADAQLRSESDDSALNPVEHSR